MGFRNLQEKLEKAIFYVIFLGKIIGTIPDECAADAIAMVKTRNEEIEERKKEKENQKAISEYLWQKFEKMNN